MIKTVLIIGGYGVFGGRLARRLANQAGIEVVVAGRSLPKAQAFCNQHGGVPAHIDLQAPFLTQDIANLAPDIVVDAAGPYQAYTETAYRLAEAALTCGAHYLDLSDDAVFTTGISALSTAAETAGLSLLSGVSSVPALSSVIVDKLTDGLSDIHIIESAILPGNRAPRGVSVMKSIIGQAGSPMRVWRGGRWTHEIAWGELKRTDLEVGNSNVIKGRKTSPVGAPDLALFPERYSARSVLFSAGLELGLLQRGLWLLAFLARWRLVKSIGFLTPLLKRCADLLEPFGSDRGGMLVRAIGRLGDGTYVERRWTLIVEAGDGPSIPTVPAWIMVQKLIASDVPAGARPALEAFTIQDLENGLAPLSTEACFTEKVAQPLFHIAFKDDFQKLPDPVIDLHTVFETRHWTGRARVERGKSFLSHIAGMVAGFPPPSNDVAVRVTMQVTSEGERWTRTFGDKRFRSLLSRKRKAGKGVIHERFGLLTFEIALNLSDGRLNYPVCKGWCLGIPLPAFLLPKSETAEFVDEHDRVSFDVSVSLPIAGHVVRYRGWLEPATD